jgi:hypothetical protein
MRTACIIGLIPISLVLAPLSYAGGGHMGGVRQKYAGRAHYLQSVANSCVLGPYS